MRINILKKRLPLLEGMGITPGFAFEWADDSVIFADTEYPETATPSGVPVIAYFKLTEEQEEIGPEVLQEFEHHFNQYQFPGTPEHYVAVVIKLNRGTIQQMVGYRKKGDIAIECEVAVIEEKPEKVFLPFQSVDTAAWQNKKVVIVGCGSLGSGLAEGLCQSGISNFVLIDNERLKRPEIHRTRTSPFYENRRKSGVLKENLLAVNPNASIETVEIDILEKADEIKPYCKGADLICCLTNNQSSFFLINKIAFELEIPVVFSRANLQASFGNIYRFDPKSDHSPCLYCMGIGQFAFRGDTIYYERTSHSTITTPVAADMREESLGIDILPYIHMLARVCFEILSGGAYKAIPNFNTEDYALLLYPTGLYLPEYDPIDNKNMIDYKKMSWYPVAISCLPGCPVCGNRSK